LSTEEVKLHYLYGKGIRLLDVGSWKPYFSFSSTRKFKNSSFKLGVANKWEHGLVDLRLRYNIGEHRVDNFFYVKCEYLNDLVRLCGIGAAHRKMNQINLQKNDLMAAFQIIRNNWVGIVLDNNGFRSYKINYSRLGSYFDSLKAVYLFKHQNLRLGLLVRFY
jgi:hypothetical protein